MGNLILARPKEFGCLGIVDTSMMNKGMTCEVYAVNLQCNAMNLRSFILNCKGSDGGHEPMKLIISLDRSSNIPLNPFIAHHSIRI
jgi:hypothetical protein